MIVAAIDIETIPSTEGIDRLLSRERGEIKAPANYKSPEKISEYIAEKQAGLEAQCTKEASLNWIFGQVASVALWNGTDGGALTLRDFDGSESGLLHAVAAEISGIDLIVSWNGHDFDAHWLTQRMLVHGITPPAVLQSRRYSLHPHCDLRQFVHGWQDNRKGTLAEVCAAHGVSCPGKDLGIVGSDVARLAREGQWDLIADYNMGDALATWGLLEKLWPALRHQIPGAAHLVLDQAAARNAAGATSAPAPVPA